MRYTYLMYIWLIKQTSVCKTWILDMAALMMAVKTLYMWREALGVQFILQMRYQGPACVYMHAKRCTLVSGLQEQTPVCTESDSLQSVQAGQWTEEAEEEKSEVWKRHKSNQCPCLFVYPFFMSVLRNLLASSAWPHLERNSNKVRKFIFQRFIRKLMF